MKRISLLLLMLACLLTKTLSQDYLLDFNRLVSKMDTLGQRELLEDWARTEPQNSDLHACYFNYFFTQSRMEPQRADSYIQKGMDWIDRGIWLYPSRLDMRFGKIYALGQMDRWISFAEEVIKVVEFSAELQNKWTWALDEPWKGGEREFLAAIQEFQMRIFSTEADSLIDNMREIGLTVLEHYPGNYESLINVGVSYQLEEDYGQAIKYLHKAHEMDEEDAIVHSNLGFCYKLTGDLEKAKYHFFMARYYGQGSIAQDADKELRELRKQ